MPAFPAPDGTILAYHVFGDGPSVVCLPGGPMQASTYLGELGGLSAHHRLIVPDLRGTGASGMPDDQDSYRCDRLVADVDALREHLGLDRMDLLGHSAGANLAVRYVERHPEHVRRLALITPSVLAVGIQIDADLRRGTASLRGGEPWYPAARAALEEIVAGRATADAWRSLAPFAYGRWDETARRHRAAEDEQRNDAAAAVFAAAGAFDPDATRAAIAAFARPVLLPAGEFDLNSPPRAVAEYAALFPDARFTVQSRAGHYPWLDDAGQFVGAVEEFLG
ncbi:alpha/beta fold hydrolase [Streptomyces sp. NPDC056161]|uniref:alpha/beta fold hydrolase n=1 Tax=Streptomyces sp. NPDC056161 TaxID=3345732 RepID=UPI0035D70422